MKRDIDLTCGPLGPTLLRYSVPLVAMGLLNLLIYTIDVAVVGRMIGTIALSATSIANRATFLVTAVFMGLTVGVNVLAAQAKGAGDERMLERVKYALLSLGVVLGVAVCSLVFSFSPTFCRWLGATNEVLSNAVLYTRIVSLSLLFALIYNFGGAYLRAVGNSRDPFRYVLIAGVSNLVLSVWFVLLGWGLAGIAWATVISQAAAAVLTVRKLEYDIRRATRFAWDRGISMRIIRLGLPAGIQGASFTLGNAAIVSGFASLGTAAIAGASVGETYEGILWAFVSSVGLAAVTFVGQCHGARNVDRMRRGLWMLYLVGAAMTTAMGFLFYETAPTIMGWLSNDPAVVDYACQRAYVNYRPYALALCMEVTACWLRGLGRTLEPTIVSIGSSVGLRLLWAFFVFPLHPTYEFLMLIYPITWLVPSVINLPYALRIMRKRG